MPSKAGFTNRQNAFEKQHHIPFLIQPPPPVWKVSTTWAVPGGTVPPTPCLSRLNAFMATRSQPLSKSYLALCSMHCLPAASTHYDRCLYLPIAQMAPTPALSSKERTASPKAACYHCLQRASCQARNRTRILNGTPCIHCPDQKIPKKACLRNSSKNHKQPKVG